jgi:hypothetical protein
MYICMHIMFLGSKVRWVRKAGNLTAIYELVGTSHMCNNRHMSVVMQW